MPRSIDLNADMGEYADAVAADNEAALMPLITTCSVACGGHAGDDDTMRRTVQLAKTQGVRVGAHPSYPDRESFGRRRIEIDGVALLSSLRKQIGDLREIANENGLSLVHVKPHGALYNDAARDPSLARIAAEAAAPFALVGPPCSALAAAAEDAGIPFIAEGFVDRTYRGDGSLTPRTEPGAVIAEVKARADQAKKIALGEAIGTADGELRLSVETLCIHSDSPGAVETARAVRDALSDAGVAIAPFRVTGS